MWDNSSDLPTFIQTQKSSSNRFTLALLVFILYGVLTCIYNPSFIFLSKSVPSHSCLETSDNPDSLCPIVDKLDPTTYIYNSITLEKILHDEKFKNESLRNLQNAIRIPTQIYDGMTDPKYANSKDNSHKFENRWKPFETFHDYLKEAFPLAHEHLNLEKINKLGLVYTWEGSDSRKKPIMLTAHYDVVPVQPETVSEWTYPPFDGTYDGKYLYGRGVSDCKDLLVGLMETIELLLSEGQFIPQRTIILSFGYDEEAAGIGAEEISKHLLERYGPSSFYQIIDEGTSGYVEVEGDKYILPAISEKGHLNSVLEIYTPGGHSSVPPKHTSIGLLSKVISIIEDKGFDSIITNVNPVLSHLQCVAEHSKTIDPKLKKTILKAHLDKKANQKLLEFLSNDLSTKYTVTTSQAVDMIYGGVKSNALPEHASVLINHRIAVEESVYSTRNKVLCQVQTFASEYGLGLLCDGEVILETGENGYFNYTTNEPLEPAPLTPVGDEIWNVFGGSLRYLYEDLLSPESNDTYIFAPYIGTGNTDTKSYWGLTRNIFRYSPGTAGMDSNIHSVDEKLLFESHLQIIAFYYYYLQVVDQLADPETEVFSAH
ncbi:hypothetical protein JCM33374_g528 [Metschnikowia sp. JCM 33374]|nr:hypothetical protein JCM33374_g528 [Metschnikowia sp. JCM 33374]